MTQRNDGRGEINSLQNPFTAYLTVAVRRCKSRYLEVLLDLIVYEMKPAELAQKLGLTYQGAMAVYYRARKKLLQQLKEDEEA